MNLTQMTSQFESNVELPLALCDGVKELILNDVTQVMQSKISEHITATVPEFGIARRAIHVHKELA